MSGIENSQTPESHTPHTQASQSQASQSQAAQARASAPARRFLTPRRLALMGTVFAGLGAFALAPVFAPGPIAFSSAAQAQPVIPDSAKPTGFADIVERVKPAVISVRVRVGSDDQAMTDMPFPPGSPFERFFRRFGPEGRGERDGRGGGRNFITGQGSGFFITADGYAVTNNHVVDHAETVQIATDDGKTYPAKVIGTDPRTDLALIKVDGRSDFPFVKLADNAPRIGDWVLAVGNPFGLGGTVTAGIVSARGRDIGAGPYDDFLQIDAPVNKGNSGGPTFDVNGSVIGVNTAIFSPSGGSVGIAFAIPAQTVKTVVAQLRDKGAVSRGWIGVQIQPVTQDIADSLGLKKAEGALVAEPQASGPAVKAGIEAGDVITAINDKPVRDAREVARTIGSMAPGATVKLTVLRKGAEKTFSFALGELPNTREAARGGDSSGPRDRDNGAVPRLGLSLAPADGVAGASGPGLVVTGVDPDSPAARFGFRPGDVITEVGGSTVASTMDVRKAMSDARAAGKKSILFRVKSGDAAKFVAVPLG